MCVIQKKSPLRDVPLSLHHASSYSGVRGILQGTAPLAQTHTHAPAHITRTLIALQKEEMFRN